MMNQRHKAYLEYKKSGLQWLGDMPSHWQLIKAKYLFRRVQREVRQNDGVVTAFRDGQVTLRANRRVDGFTESIKEIGYQGVRVGDLLVHAMDGFAGAIGISDSDGKCSPVCSVCVPNKSSEINMHYYGYLVRQLAVTDFITSLAKGIRERSTEFRFSEFSTLELALPPLAEQETITNFIDHETAKIDALIEKQQQLIKLLKEKRQAVISHAVTKGLNPNAPMRDSGVEWLGKVPTHWDVCKIKFKCREITDGAHISPVTEGGEHYFVSITDIKKGIINFENALKTSPRSYEYLVKTGCMPFTGDILFSKDGTIGQTAITPAGIDFVVSSSLIIIRPDAETVISRYLNFLLQSEVVVEQVESFVKGAALRRLSIQNLLKIGGVFPPVPEQNEICTYLENALARYDSLEAKANDLIQLLQERRTALISAAVTGKIDVRDWQAPSQTTNKKIAA